MIWGNNMVYSTSDAFFGYWIVEAIKRGSKLSWLATRM